MSLSNEKSIDFNKMEVDGSFTITLTNLNAATADTGAAVINFVIINGV